MELLPALTRAERNTVLFNIVTMSAPRVETWEQKMLKTKEDMAKIVLEHPVAEWGVKLARFVQEARRQDPELRTSPDATMAGLHLLLNYPPHSRGYRLTRNTNLDPPIRVVDVFKKPFPAPPDMPERFPAAPPPNLASYFLVELVPRDLHGNEGPSLTISYAHFAENAAWKASFHGGGPQDGRLWASTRARWCYGPARASIYGFEDYERERLWQLAAEDDPPRGCRVDFTGADQHTRAVEEADRRRQGPWTLTIDAEEDEAGPGKEYGEDWSEEFAEISAALAKRRLEKTKALADYENGVKRRRTSSSADGAREQ